MADNNINSYVEVGTSTGGSWFTTDSYLRAVNPSFGKSVGYDRTSKLWGWEQYKARFPQCEFRHQGSRTMDLGDEQYDMGFIDATHAERWVWHDFRKLRPHCRFVAFHDIVLANATVDKFWMAVRDKYPSWEFIDRSIPTTCGIGVLKIR